MQFKVGDRVEVLRPAEGTISTEANNIGLGTVERLGSDSSIKVKVDTNESAWWYERGDVRLAVKEIGIHPTPSITVGTQVRLTGVVSEIDSDGDIWIKIPDSISGQSFVILSSDKASVLEVLRQPFKRGEVVWGTEIVDPDLRDIPFDVLDDEANGRCFMVQHHIGAATFNADVTFFERRP